MKRILLAFLLVAVSAGAQQLLRVSGGVEETATIPTDLPSAVTNAYAAHLRASGYFPVEEVNEPTNSWCTRAVKTMALTNGTWRIEWVECPVPVSLDRSALCSTILSLPDGTNLLATVMAIPAVADWFVSDPVYVRGSELAYAMQLLLEVDQASLEALLHPSGNAVAEPASPVPE